MPWSQEIRECVRCKRAFRPRASNHRFCSEACRPHSKYIHTDGHCVHMDVSHGSIGAIGELLVCADLLTKGFEVFRAVSPSCSCDIIALKDGVPRRFEARTGYRFANGNVTYPKKDRDRGRADHYAVILSPTEIVYEPELT